MSASEVVGKSTIGGDVTAKLIASRDGTCRGAVADNDREQALWLFSPSACGAYGFEDLKIAHAGRLEPIGLIVLQSDKNVRLPAGSGLLLRVTANTGDSSLASPPPRGWLAPDTTSPLRSSRATQLHFDRRAGSSRSGPCARRIPVC